MIILLTLLFGFLTGGITVRWLMLEGSRRSGKFRDAAHERAVLRAVHRHLRARGTMNPTQLKQILEVPTAIAVSHLDRLERDGFLRVHHHRGRGVFYTTF